MTKAPAPAPTGDAAGSPVARVRAALTERELASEVVELSASTRTAREAAQAIGTSVGQIVKSLVFLADGRPILILASGSNRVDLRKVARLAGAAHVEKATADATRAATGFSIGGVPPLGHATRLPVFVDETLLTYPIVYAAAGTPHAVFGIAPQDLARATEGIVGDVAEGA